ncbi:MAG TPA: hypothetical protein VGO52_20420 [Hyphomonadaceae bacterium]|jgi:hypothetical protein|nr:hypothetical protein [Hyphomonadaceae bacterium]
MRAALLALVLATGVAPAFADDPPDMVAAAKVRAEGAPEALSRRTLGQVALPTYGTAKFRNVRANYIRQELINDQVIFCGELDAVIPGTTKRSGWTKFVYIPGDPTTLMTDTPGLGTREIGPQVRQRMCDGGNKNWMSADYTAAFNRMPRTLAEAEKSE